MYGVDALENLSERTEYECFFLKEVFALEEIWAQSSHMEDFRFFPGRTLVATRTTSFHLDFSAIGPRLAVIGMPLLFVSAFKVLDMVIEWVITAGNSNHGRIVFATKARDYAAQPTVPPAFHDQPWLKDVVRGLFEKVVDFRNVLIHRDTFIQQDGILTINDLEKGKSLVVSQPALRDFADFAVSAVLALRGVRALGEIEVSRLMSLADRLSDWHGGTRFNRPQVERAQLTYILDDVRVGKPIDVALMRDIAQANGRHPVECDLVVCFLDGGQPVAWRLTSAQLVDSSSALGLDDVLRAGQREACSMAVQVFFDKRAAGSPEHAA